MTPLDTKAARRFFAVACIALTSCAIAENTATIPVAGEGDSWKARHQSMSDRMAQGHAGILWIGDSIVRKWDLEGKPLWDKYYAQRDAVNLGISGDCTQQVLWRLQHCNLDKVKPKLAIVMIGQNNGPRNTAEEIADGVKAIVSYLHEQQPQMKILVLGITFRGEKPNDEQVKLARTNEILAKMADGKAIFYQNINKLFLAPDGTIPKTLMPDCEHPNEEGCRIWAEAIEPMVAQLYGDTPVKP